MSGPLLVGIGFAPPAGGVTTAPVVAFKTQTRLSPSPTQSCFTPLLLSVSTPSGPEMSLLAMHVVPFGGAQTCPILSLPRTPTNPGSNCVLKLGGLEDVSTTSTALLVRSPK